MTEGGAMLVLQYFWSLVTRQVSVALTSAGPAVQITWTTFRQTPPYTSHLTPHTSHLTITYLRHGFGEFWSDVRGLWVPRVSENYLEKYHVIWQLRNSSRHFGWLTILLTCQLNLMFYQVRGFLWNTHQLARSYWVSLMLKINIKLNIILVSLSFTPVYIVLYTAYFTLTICLDNLSWRSTLYN